MAKAFDWNGFVKMWVAYVESAIAKVAKKLQNQHVYVIAFYQGYAEASGRIDGYSVGLHTEESLAGGDDEDEQDDDEDQSELHSARWSPPEWDEELAELDGPARPNVRYYQALTKLACSSTREHWYATYHRHEAAMIDAARELTRRAKMKQGVFAKITVTPDFVAIVHDTSTEGRAKLRASMSAVQFAKLFPNLAAHEKERARIAKLPIAKRIAYYISRFSTFDEPVSSEDAERALVAIGAPAVNALTRALASKHGDTAARVLGKIGAPAASAAKALLVRAKENSTRGMWSASALGSIGRIDLLEPLARAKKTRRHGVIGLVAARPASYPVLDALLSDNVGTAEIEDMIRPGRNSYEPGPRAFAALARAAKSTHASIRKDAACALDDDSLGPDRAKARDLLMAMLADRSDEVKRLAAIGLGYFGTLGGPAVAALQALASGTATEKIREAARYSLDRLRLSGVT
jgi:hypothetical protein